ncbi:uncharacterized protein LOC111229823 [Seriola dumerili]|uniref:uncharacterized protein LOC111229823 n=1 Tax=Seriola dumerili TaxID=41447 RepID=UPI000BBE14F5|nr:uncharacterized protein LOC111229823 [Seriola dumerili]
MSLKSISSRLRSLMEKSPLGSNTVFGFILIGLEKLLEMEFACPCDSNRNVRLVVSLFINPALLAFVLMIRIQGCKCEGKTSWKQWIKLVLSSLVPPFLWWILLLLDGQYIACAKSSQSGRFVVVDNASRQKLCTPYNGNSSQELINTQKTYAHSQEAGMWAMISITIISVILMLIEPCNKTQGNVPPQENQRQDLEASKNEDNSGSLISASPSGGLQLGQIAEQ